MGLTNETRVGQVWVLEMTHKMVWVHGMWLVWYGEVMAALSAVVDPPVAGHVDAGCFIQGTESLEWKRRTKQKASQLSHSSAGYISQSTRKLSLSNVNHNLVQSESL